STVCSAPKQTSSAGRGVVYTSTTPLRTETRNDRLESGLRRASCCGLQRRTDSTVGRRRPLRNQPGKERQVPPQPRAWVRGRGSGGRGHHRGHPTGHPGRRPAGPAHTDRAPGGSMLTPVTIDFETYYSTKANGEYSLTWMTAEAYVRDPRFQIIGFSLKVGDSPSQWYSGDETYMMQVLHGIDWTKVMAIGHNMSEFDSLILTERCGIRPRAYACTLQMARALHAGKQEIGRAHV